ncbi:MAG: histone [Methanosphaera sp. rholeuAM130]|nr:histone family protein [Methanosphaera sp.]RAP54286.1 MAG: histone [Methanosphaera sp. rholeuAM130]
MAILPKAPVKRILSNSGVSRVSDDAVDELINILEEYGEEISKRSIKLAKHADRKTIKASDILLAKE